MGTVGTQHGDQCTSSPSFPSFTESVNATLFSQPTTSATATEGGTLPSVTPKPTSAASITITTQSTALGTAAATKSSAGKVVVKLRTSVTVALGAMLAMLFFHTGL